jgi:hypothetical protein
MSKKIIFFIIGASFACFVGLLTFGIGASFSTSLDVTCELQDDETYTCQARDTLLTLAVSKKQAEHVVGLEKHLKCSGTGSRKGCSHISEFITASGERIKLSSLFTTSESQVTELVNTINGLMNIQSTPINYSSGVSPWFIFTAGLSAFLFVTILFQAFSGIFQKEE